MINPTISKKSDFLPTFTDEAKRLFRVVHYEKQQEHKKEDNVPKIKVSSLISKMAFYYEKIRNSVDYEEEHLLRKNAIERIIKRQTMIEGAIFVKDVKSEEVSKHLLTELIRAGYLPNNQVPEIKIYEVSRVIGKYLNLKNHVLPQYKGEHQEKNEIVRWLIAMAASEIEEKLGGSQIDRVATENMHKVLDENIKLSDNSPYEQDRNTQIHVGICRSFFKFDRDMLSSILFRRFHPEWKDPTEEDIERIAGNIKALQKRIYYQIDHPLTGQFNRVIMRYTIFFTVLIDAIKEDPVSVYNNFRKDPKSLDRQIKKICDKKYHASRVRLWRAAVRSIIYIFITKSVFAILLEVPATRWFGEEINSISLAINISFPAILLFLVVLFTKLPSEANSDKIVEGIKEIVFVEHYRQEPYRLRRPVKRGRVLNAVFGVLYSVTFFLSFGFVVWSLDKANFSRVSIVIFLFFLAFVSFFSIRIRKNTREMIVLESKENILSFFSDFFYIPIVAAGKWMSEKFSRINVFVFILDFIIEAPFKIFVEIAEEWTKYVKERKDEIV